MLRAVDLAAFVGNTPLYTGVAFDLPAGERLAVVGPNGCGKTTLLEMLVGDREPDEGVVELSKNEVLGYLPQVLREPPHVTVGAYVSRDFARLKELGRKIEKLHRELGRYAADRSYTAKLLRRLERLTERFDKRGGYELEHRVRRVLSGLGLGKVKHGRPLNTLSGGQKTKLALARLLLGEPTLLVLDEPTNHLDLPAVTWLERYLWRSKAALIIVSHDRAFIDRLANRVLEIEPESASAHLFRGNYSAYVEQRRRRRELQLKQAAARAEERAKLEAYVRRYKAGNRSTQAHDRERKLARLEPVSVLAERRGPDFGFRRSTRPGEWTLRYTGVTAGYGPRMILRKLDLELRRGERLAVVGPNGSGKTTLLRLATGALQPRKGYVELGLNVRLGYLAQEHDTLDPEAGVLEELQEVTGLRLTAARSHLARFDFGAEDVEKPVGVLSQGEKTRLTLAQLVCLDRNLLLLDEPTNHLDFWARESMERALIEYDGAALVVSHDRYFLRHIGVERVLVLPEQELIGIAELEDYYAPGSGRRATG
jgi:ATP-binding cassette subfamily F protein 3